MEMGKIACGTQRFLEGDLRARLLAGYLRVSLRRAFPCESIWPPRLKRKFSSRSRMCCSQTLSVTRSCRSASHVRFSGCVDDPTHGSTVYAHSQLKFRMLLERAANFQRAFNGRFWAMITYKREAVACRDFDQAPRRFRGLEFIRTSDNLV